MKHYYKEIHKLGGRVFLTPDGWKIKRRIKTEFQRLDHLLEKSILHVTKRVLPLKSTVFGGLVTSTFSESNIHTQ